MNTFEQSQGGEVEFGPHEWLLSVGRQLGGTDSAVEIVDIGVRMFLHDHGTRVYDPRLTDRMNDFDLLLSEPEVNVGALKDVAVRVSVRGIIGGTDGSVDGPTQEKIVTDKVDGITAFAKGLLEGGMRRKAIYSSVSGELIKSTIDLYRRDDNARDADADMLEKIMDRSTFRGSVLEVLRLHVAYLGHVRQNRKQEV